VKQTKTEHLIFQVYDAQPGVEWPSTDPRAPCIGKRWGERTVQIVRGPDCTEADLDDMKERYENDWKEWHGEEVAADALRFHRR